jgi:2-C-methyl-D-erythritol 4-phosphate cytidylyltransferase
LHDNICGIDAVIVGAGSGTRLGHSIPKAFVPLAGQPILYYSLNTFCSHPLIGSVILVVSEDMIDQANITVNENKIFIDKVKITAGGDERWKSVRNGISCSNSKWALIHDAARPFVSHEVIDSVLGKRDEFECVITATPEVDTIRTIEGDRCGVTVDRSKLLRVGTPQLFKRELLVLSFEQVEKMVVPPTDEAALIESLGIAVGYSWGDPINFKITTKSDLKIAEALLEKNQQVQLGRG